MDGSNRMAASSTAVDSLQLLGGRLCLDYVNTVDPRVGNHRREFLASYPDLVHWSRRVGVLTEDEAQDLLRDARHRPTEMSAAFEQAIALREVMYRVFSTVARRAFTEIADLDTLKAAFVEALTHARLIPTTHGFQWGWAEGRDTLNWMLWPLVRSAVELLTSEEVKRVKECPGLGDCGWLFLDTSKNGSRQWCSMEGCGSRAKMRRQYARKRAGSSPSAG